MINFRSRLFTLAALTGFISAPAPAHAAVLSYVYDSAGRLTAINYGGTSNTAYAYDRNGNPVAQIDSINPLPPLAAEYTGLITNTVPAAGNGGVITIKLGAAGTFTGKFSFGGKSVGFSGEFAEDGSSPAITVAGFTLTLALDVVGGTEQITGTITDGSFTSAVTLDRASFDRANPVGAGLVGRYTALFRPTESTAGIPQGDGYATLTIDAAGKLRAAGKLADGSKFSHGSLLTRDGVWPLFLSLYGNEGYVAGPVVFAGNPGTSDFAGNLDWVKPATSGPLHPEGFTTELSLIGSKYNLPLKKQPVLDVASESPNVVFTAGIPTLLVEDLTLDGSNKFLGSGSPAKLKVKLSLSTGIFSGSFQGTSGTKKFQGAIFQEQEFGSGFFQGTSDSGPVTIEPKP